MEAKVGQTPAKNANPVLSVDKNGSVLYSNEAGYPLLNEWDVRVGEKLPSYIGDLVQEVISRNSPEKMEVKVGKRIYLVVFSPLPEQECINISGFDISEQKEVEGKLRESENKYRHIVETSVEGIWTFNAVSETAYVNEKMAEMLGYNREEMIGRFIWDFAYEEEKGIFQAKLANRKQGIDEVYEIKLIRKDGSPLWVSVSAKGFFDDDGKFEGSVGMFTDITDHKRAEEALRESEERFSSAFDDSAVAMALVGPDARLFKVNDAFCRLLGFEKSEMEGHTFIDFTFPDDIDPSILIHKAVINREKPFFWLEKRYIRKDGQVIWCEVSSSPVLDSKGRPIYTVAHIQDITERKRAEEVLAFERSQLLSIFDGMDDVVYVTDLYTYEVLYANKAMKEKFGGELMGGICYKEFQRKDFPCDFCTNQIILKEKGKPYHWEYYNPTVDRYFMIMDRIIRWPDGRDVRFEIAKDITERKQAEEALKKTHETLEEKVKERTIQLEKAYNSLKESEKSLSEAQKMAHIGNWDWNIITDRIHWSDEVYRIFGRSPQEFDVTYEAFLSCIHPDDQEYVNNAIKETLNGKPYDIDYRIVLANGVEKVVYSQGKILFGENNIPVRIRGFIQDITERKKAEEKIERLANIVEYANDGIGLITPEGIVLEWNKGEEQIYGYDVEDIVGRHISVIAPPHSKNEPMDHVELIKQTRTSYNYTASRLRKDGKTIEVSITLSPVFDSHGKLTAISFITRDITEQKMYEERLRESEEKYRNIVETANEGISIIDAEERITFVNKKIEDMIGYSSEELIGRSMWDFLSDESKVTIKKMLERGWKNVNESFEIKFIHKDGYPVWTHMNSKSLFDKDGKFFGTLNLHTDITKRKEAEETLRNLEIARKKEIHHRIKNNLQVISSLLDLQADKFNNREHIKYSEVLEAFKESQNRVISMALIHEELHKGEGLEMLNFSSYIKELADSLLSTYTLGNKTINLNMDLDQNIFFDMDIAIPLGIIINELVSNSLKHAFSERDKGEIRIKLHREEYKSSTFTLSVSDNGISIPEDLEIEDFEGLGLQLVTALVEQLDGKLELKRDNGTEFIIKFTVTENCNWASVPHQLVD